MLDFAIARAKEILDAAGARHVNVVRPEQGSDSGHIDE
jgi:hypothetical protein